MSWAELFFDLVFVFAVTEVSTLLEADHSWAGALRALVVFVPIYWAWVGVAIQTNVRDMSTPALRIGDVRGRAGRAVHGARRPRRVRRPRPPVRPLVLGRPPGAGVRPVLPRGVADQPVHGEHGHHGPAPGRRCAGRRLGQGRHLGTGRAHRPLHADGAAPPPAGHALRRPAPGRALRPVRADRAGRVGRGDRQLGRAGRAPGRGRRVRRGRGVHGQRRALVGVLQLRGRRGPPRAGHGPGPARRHPARPLLRPPLADRGDHRRRRGPAGGRRPPRHRPPARRRRAALRGHRAVPGHLRLHPLDRCSTSCRPRG